METYYLNLIAKSYIKLTIENDDNLALFFFQKYNKRKDNRFYDKLTENIENLINNSYTKAKEPDLSGIPDEHRDDYIRVLKTKENYYFAAMDQYSDYCAEEGLPNNTPNWEICTDATKLTNALNNEYVKLKDPINIITPSKKISKKELILKKSKLEYLKSEAERASKVSSIDELDEIAAIETNPLKSQNSQLNNSTTIKIAVQNAFKFTLEINKTKEKQILSEEDYSRLVEWVTYFFENDYKVPYIDSPITELNIGITYIRFAFKELIDSLHSKKSRPKTFYELVSKCFSALSNDTEELIQQTSKPGGYDRLMKRNSY
ncbi:hypothetical protein [Lutibacter maritimus]|uniref:Uncharacterized protein n=1 Tax=Lutibacter maritimus TaxID=593133 RepID=A0A1I6RE72_9FLAO|nr:hypothetical protein [Lutibacter maritimus]SFS63002.1 hypothetical protein SAMN04488006_2384 [Lutibacter maritimus]